MGEDVLSALVLLRVLLAWTTLSGWRLAIKWLPLWPFKVFKKYGILLFFCFAFLVFSENGSDLIWRIKSYTLTISFLFKGIIRLSYVFFLTLSYIKKKSQQFKKKYSELSRIPVHPTLQRTIFVWSHPLFEELLTSGLKINHHKKGSWLLNT